MRDNSRFGIDSLRFYQKYINEVVNSFAIREFPSELPIDSQYIALYKIRFSDISGIVKIEVDSPFSVSLNQNEGFLNSIKFQFFSNIIPDSNLVYIRLLSSEKGRFKRKVKITVNGVKGDEIALDVDCFIPQIDKIFIPELDSIINSSTFSILFSNLFNNSFNLSNSLKNFGGVFFMRNTFGFGFSFPGNFNEEAPENLIEQIQFSEAIADAELENKSVSNLGIFSNYSGFGINLYLRALPRVFDLKSSGRRLRNWNLFGTVSITHTWGNSWEEFSGPIPGLPTNSRGNHEVALTGESSTFTSVSLGAACIWSFLNVSRNQIMGSTRKKGGIHFEGGYSFLTKSPYVSIGPALSF